MYNYLRFTLYLARRAHATAPPLPSPPQCHGWSAPAAVGLKNGGLSEMTTDIIYPASRQIDGEFTGDRQLEFH